VFIKKGYIIIYEYKTTQDVVLNVTHLTLYDIGVYMQQLLT